MSEDIVKKNCEHKYIIKREGKFLCTECNTFISDEQMQIWIKETTNKIKYNSYGFK